MRNEYREMLADIYYNGANAYPRNTVTKEILNGHFCLKDSARALLIDPIRKPSYAFMVAEWLWIMFGRDDVAFIRTFNKNIEKYSDDGFTFFGAYGPWFTKQIWYIYDTLKKDIHSRRAVMTIWQQNPGETNDTPCTISLQFLIRDGKLNLIANMRSNDAYLGVPYDTFNFCQLLNLLAGLLGIERGEYMLNAGSLHLYEEHFKQAEEMTQIKIQGDPRFSTVRIPQIQVTSYQHYLAMKEHFNLHAYEIIHGCLGYDDLWAFPDGIREHVEFLNKYILKDGSHKEIPFWKEVYEKANS